MDGFYSVVSDDAATERRHDHVVRASRVNIFDQLDEFELSLRAELLDYENMVKNLASFNDEHTDDADSDPDEVTDGNKLAELSIELDFAVARPRTINRRMISRLNRVSSGSPQSPALRLKKEIIDKNHDESSGKSFGAEQKGPNAMSDTTDASKTPDQKNMMSQSPREKSSKHSQRVEGRMIQNSRTPPASDEGGGRVLRRRPIHQESRNTREQNQANYIGSFDSLPFHMRA